MKQQCATDRLVPAAAQGAAQTQPNDELLHIARKLFVVRREVHLTGTVDSGGRVEKPGKQKPTLLHRRT